MGFDTDKIYNYIQGDELYTPTYAITPLLKYLTNNLVIWECAENKNEDGNITKILRENGFKVITSTIHNGYNFLDCNIPNGVNCIITNPPFSLKNQFLKRCYEIGLPFALLLPTGTIDTKTRFELYNKYGLSLMLFDKRINYIGSNGRPPFASAWFTNNILPDKLIFERLSS